MEFEEVLLKRRSIRAFTKEPVSQEDINRLLRAAMNAPSAVNKRPWEFYVVQDPDKIKALEKIGFSNYPSPLMIVISGNSRSFLPSPNDTFWVEDVSAATENLLLEATNLSLGAVWCGIFPNKSRSEQVRKVLNIPEAEIPFNIIVVGHPDGAIPEPQNRFDEKKIHNQ
jgi:nitroreductase